MCERDVLNFLPFCKRYFGWWQSSDNMVEIVTMISCFLAYLNLLNFHRLWVHERLAALVVSFHFEMTISQPEVPSSPNLMVVHYYNMALTFILLSVTYKRHSPAIFRSWVFIEYLLYITVSQQLTWCHTCSSAAPDTMSVKAIKLVACRPLVLHGTWQSVCFHFSWHIVRLSSSLTKGRGFCRGNKKHAKYPISFKLI